MGDDERKDLRVFRADPVVGGRRQAELAAQAPQEVGGAPDPRSKAGVGLGHADGVGHEHAQRKGESSSGHAPRDVLERDPCFLERRHQTNNVDVRRRKVPVVAVGFEDPETLEPANVVERAWSELGELLRRDLGHRRRL